MHFAGTRNFPKPHPKTWFTALPEDPLKAVAVSRAILVVIGFMLFGHKDVSTTMIYTMY